MSTTYIGMNTAQLETPVATIDVDKLHKNIDGFQSYLDHHQISNRPHIKTHKIPDIARMQMDAGAVGITCQTLGEAEVMARAGIEDIFLPYNLLGEQKLARLMSLSRLVRVSVTADSNVVVDGLSMAAKKEGIVLPVLVEFDTGGKRCGVQSPQAVLALAQTIVDLPCLDFQGVMTYPSQLGAKPFIDETLELLQRDGISVSMVSGGGTGNEAYSKQIGCTETRSGSYIYEGMQRVGPETVNPETCALRMIVTVVSTPVANRIIIDGGMKTFTSYPPIPYGYIIEQPEVEIYGMSVEHGHIDVSGSSHRFQVGDQLSVIPVHQGMTSNLHDELIAVREGQVEASWPIEGRGKVK